MQGAVDADPAMPVYSLYQGLFYAVAVQRGDAPSATEAIRAYERFVEMEPDFAPAWANLSVLYERTGQPDAALDAARRAADVAPKAAPLGMRLGSLYEARGEAEAAREAYRLALDASPDYALEPFWSETPLRREVARAPEIVDRLSETAQVLRSLVTGQDNAARRRLDAANRTQIGDFGRALFQAILADSPEEQERLYALFVALAARESFDTVDAEALTLLGRAATACALGKTDEAAAALARLETIRGSIPFVDADSTIGFFVQMQFYRIGVSPFFLPGDAWPILGPTTELFWQVYEDRFPECGAGQPAGPQD
jgi:tetratricopeptide (TPR) repeat protein